MAHFSESSSTNVPQAREAVRDRAKMDDPEDKLCNICCVEPSDVYFVPCCHRSCAQCVQKLRIANIYKADKGVRCPFCRQVVEGYSDTPPMLQKETKPVAEAPKGPDPRTLYGRNGIQSIGQVNEYVPPRGISEHIPTLDSLRTDEIPEGYIIPPLTAKNDIVDMIHDKTGARHLDFMLRDTYSKRGKVARQCVVLGPHLSKLAAHPFANFVIQRLLDYAHTHRDGPDGWPGGFLTLLKAFCANGGLVEAAKEQRGTFACQRLALWLRTQEDVAVFITSLKGHMVTLALDPHGYWVIERLAESFITSLAAPVGAKRNIPIAVALKGLQIMCEDMGPQAARLSKHQQASMTLVECIRWCVPAPEAMSAAMTLADSAREIVGSRYPNRALQGLLTLNVPIIAEAIISQLRGKHAELCLDKGPSLGPKLTKSILATPCVGDEHRVEIVDELLHPAVIIPILENVFATDTLAFGLALLPRRFLDVRLDRLTHVERRQPSFILAELIKLIHQNRVICGIVSHPQKARPNGTGASSAPQSRPPSAEALPTQANGQPLPGSFAPNPPARVQFPKDLFQNLEGFEPAAPPNAAQPIPPSVTIPAIPSAPPPAPYSASELTSVNNSPMPDTPGHSRVSSFEGGGFTSGNSPPEGSYLPPHKVDKIREPSAVFLPGPKEANGRAPRVDPQEALARVERNAGYVPPHIRKVAEQAKGSGAPAEGKRDDMCGRCNVRLANMVLLDCAHLCACSHCAPFLKNCPTCHAPVMGVIEVEIPPHKGPVSEAPAPSTPTERPPDTPTGPREDSPAPAPSTPSPKAGQQPNRARAPYNPLKPTQPQQPGYGQMGDAFEPQPAQFPQQNGVGMNGSAQPHGQLTVPAQNGFGQGAPLGSTFGQGPSQAAPVYPPPPMAAPLPSGLQAPGGMPAAPPAGVRRPAPYRPPLAYRPPGV